MLRERSKERIAIVTPTGQDNVFADMARFRIDPRYVGRVWGWNDLHPWYDRASKEEPIGEVWLTGGCMLQIGDGTACRQNAGRDLQGASAGDAGRRCACRGIHPAF